jgi:2-keto-4-pentenoate hydratase/2-oxohepta-3-ene-1,7-dioic acid hydratase in catechol pathway
LAERSHETCNFQGERPHQLWRGHRRRHHRSRPQAREISDAARPAARAGDHGSQARGKGTGGLPGQGRGDAAADTPPDKNICVGINYPERSAEYKDGREAPKYPNLFCRFPTSLVGADQPIVRPKVSDKFDYEGEIVLVIGKEGRHVPA